MRVSIIGILHFLLHFGSECYLCDDPMKIGTLCDDHTLDEIKDLPTHAFVHPCEYPNLQVTILNAILAKTSVAEAQAVTLRTKSGAVFSAATRSQCIFVGKIT